MTDWTLTYEGFDPRQEPLREALCTLGNGYFATRGAAPEAAADGVHYPGTYAAGCFNRLTSEVAGRRVENECMVNLPNWLPLTFRIEDGPWFALPDVDVLEYRQELDLKRGVLTRSMRFRDPKKRHTRLVQRRFVHMELEHLAGLQTTIVAEDWSGEIVVRSGLDGTVENSGVARYRQLAGRHLSPLGTERLTEDSVLLVAETNQSHIRIAEAARTRFTRDGEQVPVRHELVAGRSSIALDSVLDLEEGAGITVEKVVALYLSRDAGISEPATEAVKWIGRAPGFEELIERQALAWDQLWRQFHVWLEGEEHTLRVLRLHLFHVLQTVSPNSIGRDVGVPPRGLHGEAYRGHVFWDELFIFPILNLRVPELTRSLLAYRYRRLPEARWAAREAGYAGAMYPWQSGSDGREESQLIHLNPRSGRWVPDATHRQRHIGIAVAYNVWQYYQVTGDRSYLGVEGAELLVEIARFWCSIASYDRSRDRYVIRGVVGPDEFHTGYPDGPEEGIDNNAYTNVMAVWVMLRALDALDLISSKHRRELGERLGLRREELEQWEDISRKMFVPFHDDGIISQFEGYEHLEEFDWERYRRQYGDLHRLDRILEAEGDSANRYKASKQADALMLFYLLSADELCEILDRLGYRLEREAIPRNIDYHLERTSHGSTLSSVVHAWVLARAHREQALEFFVRTLEADVLDIQGGTTPEGIHLAAMAGSVDLLQRCFAGLETRGDVLWLNTHWPEQLGALEFAVSYRGHDITLRVTDGRTEVSTAPGDQPPIHVGCRGKVIQLGPGETHECPF